MFQTTSGAGPGADYPRRWRGNTQHRNYEFETLIYASFFLPKWSNVIGAYCKTSKTGANLEHFTVKCPDPWLDTSSCGGDRRATKKIKDLRAAKSQRFDSIKPKKDGAGHGYTWISNG